MQTINFIVPQDWHELSDSQLRYVYRLLADSYPIDELKTICFLHWSKTKVIASQHNQKYLLNHDGHFFDSSALQLAELTQSLNWLADLPAAPVRMDRIARHNALPADFQGVQFEKFLVCENLYQGFLSTHRDQFLDEIGTMLYQFSKPHSFTPWQRIAIFYWVAALKNFLAQRFNDFFQPLTDGSENLLGRAPNLGAQLQESMDAQIRALTKGDITKEQEILALDTWRALTELNAQAKEYKELNAKIHATK
jgi:uncharacterized protein YbjQ (UPF0145 family)